MTVEQLVSTIATLAGLTFVVGSMFATGLSLTVGQIVQPLKNARLVILALVANFALVPLLGYCDHARRSARRAPEGRPDRAARRSPARHF